MVAVVAVVVVDAAAQVGLVIVLVSSVTAPFWASTRPSTVAPWLTVMLVRARMVPTKVELVSSVAELPTCQKTLQACAPPVRVIVLELAVTRSDVAWKIQTASASPLSVRLPVRLAVVAWPNW